MQRFAGIFLSFSVSLPRSDVREFLVIKCSGAKWMDGKARPGDGEHKGEESERKGKEAFCFLEIDHKVVELSILKGR
jgi:hypothetical protein